MRSLAEYPVPNANEISIAGVVNEFELQVSRQERVAGTKSYRRELHPELIQEPSICKLASEIATAHNPDVFAVCSCDSLGVCLYYGALHKANISAFWNL